MRIHIEDDYYEDTSEKALVYEEDEQIIDCDDYKVNNLKDVNGKIKVYCRLGNENGVLIKSAKINLYMLNGLSPKLISSKFTNENGQVIFENLKKGSYRVIAIVDRKFFEKPTYLQWNEVNIDSYKQSESITVINKVKKNK